LSDFRDTHYIDMIWLDFLGYDYEGVERSVRNTLATQHSFRPDDRRALNRMHARSLTERSAKQRKRKSNCASGMVHYKSGVRAPQCWRLVVPLVNDKRNEKPAQHPEARPPAARPVKSAIYRRQRNEPREDAHAGRERRHKTKTK
jgi:hypothetical protein